jgi:hypothetical protein
MLDPIPRPLVILLESALSHIADSAERTALQELSAVLAPAVWRKWLASRPVEDNRPEHEFIVLQFTLKITEAERLSVAEKRLALAVVFLHDTHFIPRITEAHVAAASPAEQADLERRKREQRETHMRGGAENARELLRWLNPRPAVLFTPAETDRIAEIIAHHDDWKLGRPHPSGSDRLAVSCLEGDALWPLHPLGVEADLERANADVTDAAAWRKQLQRNVETLHVYRKNWHGTSEAFRDDVSIFRTAEGHRLYRAYRELWNV